MFKRLFWLSIGFGSGLGASWYVVRSVKRTVRRTVHAYAPVELAARAGDGVRDVRANLRAALAEGREAMREREEELRARVERSRRGAASPAPEAEPEPEPGPGAPSRPDVTEATDVADLGDALVPDELAARRNRPGVPSSGRARTGR